MGDARRGVAADVGRGDAHQLGAVRRAEYHATARRHPSAQEQSIELDALVAQRVALVHADDGGRQAAHVVLGCERGPRERVLRVERLDAVGHRGPVVVQVDEDAVVLD